MTALTMPPPSFEAPAGLEGVVVATTTIGDVRGDLGYYHYRGIDAVELARSQSVEAVWHLLHRGHLPDEAEERAFAAEVRAARAVDPIWLGQAVDVAIAPRADGSIPTVMGSLRTVVSAYAASAGMAPWLDAPQHLSADAIAISAALPVLVAAIARRRRGEAIVPSGTELSYGADLLRMMRGSEPDAAAAAALEQYLVTTIDHGFNASTFTARVIASTGADLGAAVVGAIGAMSGPLHGGAPSLALDMLRQIGEPGRAGAWVDAELAAGRRIMGFGHRVYRTEDPRARLLREVARTLGGPLVDLALGTEEAVLDRLARKSPMRPLRTNVEYWAAVVLERVGISPELFTAVFTASRTIGWSAHVLEQASANRLIRPASRYQDPATPATPATPAARRSAS